jgi:RNA polymerase sigma-70 factor (ECF subfamily)
MREGGPEEATLATATVEEAIPDLLDELEGLFQAHHRSVFGTAFRITGNAADAEDVVQTVFLRLAGRDRAAPRLENAESYLRRAAINAALDVLRARRAEGSIPLDDSQPGPSQPEPSDLRDFLRRALAKLSPEAAEIFTLRFFGGHSNREIARLLGMSQVGVAVALHRARRRLQKEISSYLGGKS